MIEALVYLALFSILMGGAVVAAFSLFDAATRVSTRTMLQEETDFMLSKIDWSLAGAQAVTAPGAGGTGGGLTVVKWDGALGNPFIIAKNGNNITLTRGAGTPAILNNTNITVTSLSFTHHAGSGDGTNPESVVSVITTSAVTPSGMTLTKTATSTVYLRR